MVAQSRVCSSCGSLIEPTGSNRSVCAKCRGAARVGNAGGTTEKYLAYKITKAKYRAKTNKMEFNLTVEILNDIYEQQKGFCAVSGLPLLHTNEEADFSISIDRLDNDKGYTDDNIRLVCRRVNLMRNNLTTEMFDWWCKQIAKD